MQERFSPGQLGKFYNKITNARDSSNTLIYCDAKWGDILLPHETDTLPTLPQQLGIFSWFQNQNYNPNGYMANVAMPRHSQGINLAMVDGPARYVAFNNLWSLKWSLRFITRDAY